jgi:hypothetical protein
MLRDLEENPNNGAAYNIALALVMIAALTFGYFGLQQRIAQNWPATEAVIKSAVQEDSAETGYTRLYRQHIKVIYDYSVGGKNYSTQEIAAPLVTVPEGKEYMKKYAVGTKHQIRYNPASPAESELASVSKNARHFLIIGGGLFICAIVGFLFRNKIAKQG